MVDSQVWIDYFGGIENLWTNRLEQLLGINEVAVGDLIVMEVLQGFRAEKDYRTARFIFDQLVVHELLGRELAIQCADNYRALRKKGVTIRKNADVIIATYCIENEIPLLSTDRDFQPFVKYLGLEEDTV